MPTGAGGRRRLWTRLATRLGRGGQHSPSTAANYAAFYAASAVLIQLGRRFVKHSGVRAAVHRDLVKPGLLAVELGVAYDQLLELRQSGDYVALTEFTSEDVERALGRAARLVDAFESLLDCPR